jgi:molecular chaperone GrpE
MSDPYGRDPFGRPHFDTAPDTAPGQSQNDQGRDDQGRDEQAKVAALIETLSKEAADYKDRLLRTLAEMENLRRRTEREVADSRVYAISNFARDILAVADNMERALGALDKELREKADSATKALLDGVELTERELLKVLEKHGVKKFEPLGEKFDPNLHQAMYEVPDPSRPAGTVAQVVQPGYMIGERVLRPALVGVAKGGPKLSEAAPANDNAGSPQTTN